MPAPATTRQLAQPDLLARTRAYFDGAAPRWDDMRHAGQPHMDAILEEAGVPCGGRVLDVACGTGVLFPALLRRRPALLRAIDLSPGMVAVARQKFPGGEVLVSAEDFYTFGETGFDCVVVYNAYPHFMDKPRFAAAAHACLAPGGRLVIAHGCGRARLNSKHQSCGAHRLSHPLRAPQAEAASLGGHFAFDVAVDADDRYILSGTARGQAGF